MVVGQPTSVANSIIFIREINLCWMTQEMRSDISLEETTLVDCNYPKHIVTITAFSITQKSSFCHLLNILLYLAGDLFMTIYDGNVFGPCVENDKQTSINC